MKTVSEPACSSCNAYAQHRLRPRIRIADVVITRSDWKDRSGEAHRFPTAVQIQQCEPPHFARFEITPKIQEGVGLVQRACCLSSRGGKHLSLEAEGDLPAA